MPKTLWRVGKKPGNEVVEKRGYQLDYQLYINPASQVYIRGRRLGNTSLGYVPRKV